MFERKMNARAAALALVIALGACGGEPAGGADVATEVMTAQADAAVTTTEAQASAGALAPPVGEIDEDAVAVLKRMTATVAALSRFSLTMEIGFDVTQPNGEKLEFGSRRSASIARPDMAHFTFEKRTGEAGGLVFDGSDIWAYDLEDNVYASIPQPGDIDASIDFATTELGIPVPASDFFAADPSGSLAEGVLDALDLGPSTIGGRKGHHIAMRKPGVNYQIWVADEDSLPTRVVITYTEEPGQPQFWAQFIVWDLEPETGDDTFQFKPPEGSERIRFATYDSSVETDEEVVQ